ncbi:PAS domain-containing protein (plasmid) [Rhizobium sp. 32-5/1]|uniref:PAS domain-containing protein n=1 Tax=Rhizobium sp. 32-5/1 TaxID=3019602 RepID=UPI00240E91B7|nr:PAS domain-containing protein [Rhizobium sp. 32-5/1]WEZ85687.1 PAS domain-containing protein [Rhizobium sp. 32-5/1]
MADQIRSFAWNETPLGPIEQWGAALKITVDAMLSNTFPQCLFWGRDLIAVYNDGYLPMLGNKEEALGKPLRVSWSENWEELKPIADKAMSGEAVSYRDFPLQTTRNGQPETAYFTFCYSPIRDDTGVVVGMIDTVIETTEAVDGRQRLLSETERYRQMFANAPGFMMMLSGPEHIIQFSNPAYLNLVGTRDVVGKTVREALPDAVEQGYLDLLDTIWRTGEPYSAVAAHYAVQAAPGDPITDCYVDFVYQPVKDNSGNVTGIFVSGVDVTERTAADRALRQSEARLRFLDDLARETGWRREADGILSITTKLVGEYLQISNCAYADMDEDEDGFTIRGDWSAAGSPSIVGHYSLAAFGKLAVWNLSRGLPLVINDNLVELAPEEAKTFQDIGIAATICMPLIREGSSRP